MTDDKMMCADSKLPRVLVADDEEMILDCYRMVFTGADSEALPMDLDDMEAELFDDTLPETRFPRFEFVSCAQGDEAVVLCKQALADGHAFDVVILDVSMPPGIDGVQAGRQIRAIDPDVAIIFVTGFSDMPAEDIAAQVPPKDRMRCLAKPVRFEHVVKLAAELAG